MNIKEVITGFTIDVIATTSFAVETNANDDRSKKNAFLDNGVKLLDLKLWRFLAVFMLPQSFNRLIGNSVGFNDKHFNFFRDISRAVIKQRKQLGNGTAKRNDLVQLMMDAFVYENELQDTNYNKLTASAEDGK